MTFGYIGANPLRGAAPRGLDGRETFFPVDRSTVTLDPTGTGILSKSADTWTFISNTNERFIFDRDGRLTTQIDAAGRAQQPIYTNGFVRPSC